MVDERRLHPRLTATALEEAPFVPELSPVVDPRGGSLMTRPWLDWARRMTLLVGVDTGGGGTGTGDVVGPAGAGPDAIAIYNGSTGKIIKDSLKTIGQVISDAVDQSVLAILPGGTLPLASLPLHSARHSAGAADPVSVLNLAGYPGGTTQFLRADGTFQAPPAGTGDVVGPASATHNAIALFNTTTGKLLKDSTVLMANVALVNIDNHFVAQTLGSGTWVSGPQSVFYLNDTNAVVDQRVWRFANYSDGILRIDASNDALNATSGGITITRAGVLTAAGLGTTPLNASNLTTGTVADARLSANVALENITNVFTADQELQVSGVGRIWLRDLSQPADARIFRFVHVGQILKIQATNDLATVEQGVPLLMDRAGNVTVGNNLTVTGTGGNVQLKPIGVTDLPNHGSRHNLGAADPVIVTSLAGYPGGTATFLRADGSFAVPPGGGSGGGDVFLASANVFTQNQTISKAQPRLVLIHSGGTAKGRLVSLVANHVGLMRNLDFDGASFNLDDTSTHGAYFVMQQTGNLFYAYTPAGANPRTPTTLFSIDSAGNAAHFGTQVRLQTPAPQLMFNDTSGASDAKNSKWTTLSGTLQLYMTNDADTVVQSTPIVAFRNGDVFIGGRITSGKGLAPRISAVTDVTTITPNIDLYDIYAVNAITTSVTMINSAVTPLDGFPLIIRLRDNGTARPLGWGTQYMSVCGVALPSTTAVFRLLSMAFRWNSYYAKWQMLALVQE